MSRYAASLAALVIALAWLCAQTFSSWMLAAVTLSVAIALGCGATELMGKRHSLALMAIGAGVLTLTLVVLLHFYVTGAEVLLLQIGFLAVLTPVVPLAYALTFESSDLDRSES
ncbi:MAG: hypothetical protein GY906_09945 [bacterium]|nr:hypothetical protein [bacterium]